MSSRYSVHVVLTTSWKCWSWRPLFPPQRPVADSLLRLTQKDFVRLCFTVILPNLHSVVMPMVLMRNVCSLLKYITNALANVLVSMCPHSMFSHFPLALNVSNVTDCLRLKSLSVILIALKRTGPVIGGSTLAIGGHICYWPKIIISNRKLKTTLSIMISKNISKKWSLVSISREKFRWVQSEKYMWRIYVKNICEKYIWKLLLEKNK